MDPERRQYLDLFRRAIAAAPPAPPPGEGRGIVTCGSVRFARLLWLLVRSLRHHGCTLPIELWHLHGEVDDRLAHLLGPEGVSFRLAPEAFRPSTSHPRAVHGLKPYAIAHSRFREVLFLDADNSAFRDPTFLFETTAFRRHRAIFWPDLFAIAEPYGRPDLRRDFGLRDAGQAEFESGQIVLDKADRWQALAATLHLNDHADYYYRFLYGDKETFRLAFDFLGADYFVIPVAPAHRHGLVQHWTDTRPLFHHRCGSINQPRVRPSSFPALPATELRRSLRHFRRRWRLPARERLDQYGRALRRFLEKATNPTTVRLALTRRLSDGVAWLSERGTRDS